MKLELKHLAGYLPYKLKGIMYYGGCVREDVELGLMDIPVWLNGSYPIKPILRPLSDLTKDEFFDLHMDLCEELGVFSCEHLLLALQDNLKYAFNTQHLNILEEFMNKNHFDWKYNLIENYLAIDINTLEK
jgi:hypothetical protein